MKHPFRTPLLLFLACSACFTAGSVQSSSTQDAPFLISESTRLALEEEPEVLAELEAALTEYFGTRFAPHFKVLDEWKRIGLNPNASPFQTAPFGADLGERRPGTLRADNRRAFASELRAIEDGQADSINSFRRQPILTRRWREFRNESSSLESEDFKVAATRFFVDHYPDLEEGTRLFANSCGRCHGINGAGDGPMSSRLVPRPRNYRAGLFKFAAVEPPSKPRRTDILRTLLHGLPGSAMPSFRARSVAVLNALVDQVRLLSIRGEVERRLLFEWTDAETRPKDAIEAVYTSVWQSWIRAASNELKIEAPPPDSDPARYARGRELFLDTAGGNCVSCHGPDGRGDGASAFELDSEGVKTALLKDEWGNFIAPRDLTSGVFRGGDRREDIYLRTLCGIPGTPMPALTMNQDSVEAQLQSEADRWSLVDYVLSLSGRGPLAGMKDQEP